MQFIAKIKSNNFNTIKILENAIWEAAHSN